MFYGTNINDMRQFFFDSWQKFRRREPLQPLEQQLVAIIAVHPEYHAMLEAKTLVNDKVYAADIGQGNPFLHLGLHLAIRDQIAVNKPVGISLLYNKLLEKYHDALDVEHKMMDCLAESLWQAQRACAEPDEKSYLLGLTKLLHC